MRNDTISVSNRYAQIKQLISQKIAFEPDTFIIGNTTQDLLNYYYTDNHFLPLEIDPQNSENIEIKKERRIIPAHKRELDYQYLGDVPFEFETLFLHVPLLPNSRIDEIKSLDISTYSTGYNVSDLIWGKQIVTVQIPVKGYGYNNDDDTVQQLLKNFREWLYHRLYHLKTEIEGHNIDLRENITQWITSRKAKIENDNQRHGLLLKKIDIPLQKKEDEAVKRIKLDKKPVIHKIRPTPVAPEDYQIDRQKVIDIVGVLDNQGRQFEKTPKSYVSFGEEDLRNVLLVNLNSLFGGKATGETFSSQGKSDIYLNIDKGNILVFECKVWGGKIVYHETIAQLLGYLTWRYNYGVIIFFSRNKSFTNVLSEIQTSVESHLSYLHGFHKIGDTHLCPNTSCRQMN